MTMLAAAVGAYVNMFTTSFLGNGGMLAFLGTIGCLFALGSSRGSATTERLGMLLGFGFFSGTLRPQGGHTMCRAAPWLERD